MLRRCVASVLPFALTLVVWSGCSENGRIGGGQSEPDAASALSDADTGVGDGTGGIGLIDTGAGGTKDTGAVDTGPIGADAGAPCDEVPAPFGCACEGNEDCLEGWCVEGIAGLVCTKECVTECPGGWQCLAVQNAGQDLIYLCVPIIPELCATCAVDDDCGGPNDLCVPIGKEGENVCTGACGPGFACPKGFHCETAKSVEGTEDLQCVPVTGSCECTEEIDGTVQACSVENEHGKCFGERSCDGAAGWSTCSANTPAPEECNGLDDDCDGEADEDLTGLPCTTDNEHGSCPGTQGCDGKKGWLCEAPAPSAEACNGKDDDCDGETDEGFPDTDGDGAKDCLDDDMDDDGAPNDIDCAPLDPEVHNGAKEVCNGKDDDCDKAVDEPGSDGCKDAWQDKDEDGFGGGESQCVCAVSKGWSETGGDCADLDVAAHPGAQEICNGKDDDCDGEIDEGDVPDCVTFHLDADGDGYGVDGDSVCACQGAGAYTATKAGDCEDGDAEVNPGAPEACNGKDDDCDGGVDEQGADGCTTYHVDADGDGYGASNDARCLCAAEAPYLETQPGDCDDADPGVSPIVSEVCNGKDDDCDFATDEEDAAGCTAFYEDKDQDQFGNSLSYKCFCGPTSDFTALVGGDCVDVNQTVYPGAPEQCNGLDDDCDGGIDDDALGDCTVLYQDLDGDGYGDPGFVECLCAPEGAYTAVLGGDCHDGDASVHPGVSEQCNGKDDDCDDIVDEPSSKGCAVYFEDLDHDGFGTTKSQCLCGPGAIYAATIPGDCNDLDALVRPGVPESCNGYDDDCDGVVDEACDQDADGWCDGTKGYEGSDICPFGGGDCNDFAPGINPGTAETCDTIDNDCDGLIDEGVQSPCGGCSKVCQFTIGPTGDSPFTGVSEGTGKDENGNLMLDSSTVKFTMLWVANSGEGTISKLDTESGKEVARYKICSDPSRTAVDVEGACWVGCRGDGNVAKIALDPAKCVDKNGNGTIETSQDSNGDGVIAGAEMLPQGTDECVLFVVNPDGATIARAVAVDKDNYAWVGFWNSGRLHRLDPNTGQSVAQVDLTPYTSARPYGMALDQKGRIWVALRDGSPPGLAMVDLTKFPITPKVWGSPSSHNAYGMAVDSLGRVWLAGGEHKVVSRFDPDTQTWKTTSLAQYPNVRGVAASTDGKVYVAHHNFDSNCPSGQDHYVSVFDAASGNWTGAIDTSTGNPTLGPTGVAIDFSGNLWAINQCASSATKIDRATNTVIGHYPTGANPYTYSDMTGFALKTVVAPEGTYIHTFEGWAEGTTQWYQILAGLTTPQGTYGEVRYRTADDLASLEAIAWSVVQGPYPPALMPIDLTQGEPVTGRYLQVEIRLVSAAAGQTPLLKSVVAVAAATF